MDVKESHQVLELEIGASRAAVDDAYCRLLERWHPDRAAAGGPEAIREAQRMVQAINEAHQTLIKIAPTAAKPSAPLPTGGAPATPVKPRLLPVLAGPPASSSAPPPRPPPPETWAARPAPVASARPPSPTSTPVTPALEPPVAPPAPPSNLPAKAVALYDTLFPVDSPQRRFGPIILVAAFVLVLLLGKCALSSVSSPGDASPDPRKAGRLVVKSNVASATVAASRIVQPGDPVTPSFNGTIGQPLSGLPPGKYAVTVRAEGWPETRGEATLEAGRTTEVAINFKSGSLRLDSDPTGAAVRLGSEALGRTPLVIPNLPPGDCQLALDYPSWPSVSFKITIAENVEATGSVRLPHGRLTVETTPPGASVLLGKQALGQTPLTLERFPAGTRKLTLQAKDFPPLEVSVTVEDRGEVKVRPALGSGFPVLDPAALLRSVWLPETPNRSGAPVNSVTGPSQPRNGLVRNLERKKLFEQWLLKQYCYTAIVKSYDRASGQVEFAEQPGELSKYRVLAILSTEARNDPDRAAQLIKGAKFAVYGRLSAVEEPRWPSKVITFELSPAEPLR